MRGVVSHAWHELQEHRVTTNGSDAQWRRLWRHSVTSCGQQRCNVFGWVQAGGGELAEALAWLQARGADSDGSDAEGDGSGALSALAAQVASLPPGARSSQQVCTPGRRSICFRALSR